jgi:hypothetical protein
MDRVHLMSNEHRDEAVWQIAVEQHAHAVRIETGGLRRGRRQRALGEFKHRNRVFAGNTWELSEEPVDRITGFEIVDQTLHRHASSREDGRAPEAIGRAGDERVW